METRKAALESEIAGLKQILAQSDYKAIKFAEGQISKEDYEETKNYRQELRDKINILEGELAELKRSSESENE